MRSAKDLGAYIFEKRKKAGLTQEAFAGSLGISAQAVSKWENGV
ncbi:MAG: helix-turn-helix transcriptional regulator, partial [Clostridia bacterium]|nr:helix-turn-helix transcriptional regulator [Clostridia bacterium]